VWVNNSLAPEPDVRVAWTLSDLEGRQLAGDEEAAEVAGSSALCVATAEWPVAELEGGLFILRLEARAPDGRSSVNHYVFSTAPDPILAPLLTAPRTEIAAERTGGGLEIANAVGVWAIGAHLVPADGSWATFSSNYLLLAPGEACLVAVSPPETPVSVRGLNCVAEG
jgi:hypothetical protein